MRWMLALAVLSCAREAPPARAPTSAPAPISATPAFPTSDAPPPPSRSLAERFETRRIGASAPAIATGRPGRLVDIEVHDADVHDVLRLLADVGKVNIVVADDVSGRVSMRLRRVPWRQALDAVTSMKGLAVVGDADLLIVTSH